VEAGYIFGNKDGERERGREGERERGREGEREASIEGGKVQERAVCV
jgi:hypothetical protein